MSTRQPGALVALLLISTAAYAEPLDVKLGLWETTITTEMSGMPPIDTSRMTPEQKARIEAAMKARQAQGARTRVFKSCLTREKLEREPFQNLEDKDGCTNTVISHTRTQWHARIACTGEQSRAGEMKLEALSRERIKGSSQLKASDASHAMTVRTSFSGKWLGPRCGDVK